MLKIQENSNIFEVKRGFIMHQTNCLGAHGGLAGAIFSRWPNALKDYLDTVKKSTDNPFALLGRWTTSSLDSNLSLINFFGQVEPSREYRTTQYYAYIDRLPVLRKRLECLKQNYAFVELNIPYRLGCGLAGGDWNMMYKILDDALGTASFDVIIHKLPGEA